MTRTRTPRDCRARLERLFAYIDGELSPARLTALERHLAGCPCCHRLEQELRRSMAACRAAGAMRLPRAARDRARRRVRRLLRTAGR